MHDRSASTQALIGFSRPCSPSRAFGAVLVTERQQPGGQIRMPSSRPALLQLYSCTVVQEYTSRKYLCLLRDTMGVGRQEAHLQERYTVIKSVPVVIAVLKFVIQTSMSQRWLRPKLT